MDPTTTESAFIFTSFEYLNHHDWIRDLCDLSYDDLDRSEYDDLMDAERCIMQMWVKSSDEGTTLVRSYIEGTWELAAIGGFTVIEDVLIMNEFFCHPQAQDLTSKWIERLESLLHSLNDAGRIMHIVPTNLHTSVLHFASNGFTATDDTDNYIFTKDYS